MATPRRVLIMGAAGRDFHNFNTVYRDDPGTEVVVFSYSDVSHEYVMHRGSQVLAAGASFVLLGPNATMLRAEVPVVAVCEVRTGSGKSQTTRRVAEAIRSAGKVPVVVRHPMPYGDLTAQRVQRFATFDDLDAANTTVEEREEYEHHLKAGSVVFAGVDYGAILEQAERECDVLLWDGGNNDLPFYRPDVHIVVADPLRAGHEMTYHPGEANLRMADVIVINKVDSASPEQLAAVQGNISGANPGAIVILANSPVTVDDPAALAGKRVVVVEDGPTLTHGDMKYGAGVVAARRAGAEIVDPRPYATGTLKETYEKYDVGPVLPAMGYSAQQLGEMRQMIDSADCDLVVIATPIDLRHLIELSKPAVRVTYELDEVEGSPTIRDVLAPILG